MRNTAPVVDLLADAEGVGASTISRLEADGIETVADLHAVDRERLTAIPYVSDRRAKELQSLAAEVYTDPSEVVLSAKLGDRLRINLAHRRGWSAPRTVIAADAVTEWETATESTWQTRRLRVADTPTTDSRDEYDLIVDDGRVFVTGGAADNKHWAVASVEFDGTVQRSTLIQLKAEQRDENGDGRPEGDDTWRQYHQRGEA